MGFGHVVGPQEFKTQFPKINMDVTCKSLSITLSYLKPAISSNVCCLICFFNGLVEALAIPAKK